MKHGKLTRRLQKKVRKVISGGTTRLLKPEVIETEIAPDEMPLTLDDEVAPDESFNFPVPDDALAVQPSSDIYAGGVLRLDKSSRLPTALAEASEHNEHGWLPGTLVITISLLAILFIVMITWFISQMPAK